MRVRLGAGPALHESLRRAVDGRSTSAPYWGPCAQAIDERAHVFVENIASDGRWSGSDWALACQSAGLFSCWATPIQASDGRVLGSFAVYHDRPARPSDEQMAAIRQINHLTSLVIERSQAVEALKRSEGQLARAQRISGIGSFSYIAATSELSMSEETCRICGFDPSKPVDPIAMRDRIHPEDLHHFKKMLSGSAQRYEFDCRVRLDDGTIRHVHTIGDAICDENGKFIEWVGVMRDTTDEKALQQALQETRSALARVSRVTTMGALTATLTHEINQPLTGVVTNTGLLQRILEEGAADISGIQEAVLRVRRDAIRAAQVVQRLQAWFSNKGLSLQPVDLNDALEEIMALLRQEVSMARVRVELELEPNLPHVAGDRVQLQQVMVNLILNALEAMAGNDEGRRTLVVRTGSAPRDYVRMCVRDAGTGFRSQDAHRLFDSFYTTKEGGMGLGLSISRAIIENHQGRIWAENNEGVGATVIFTLPSWRGSVE